MQELRNRSLFISSPSTEEAKYSMRIRLWLGRPVVCILTILLVWPETSSLRSLICVSHVQIIHNPFNTSLWAWNVTLDSSAAKLLYDNNEPAMGAQHGGQRIWKWKKHRV